MKYMAIVAEQAQQQPNATARFTCELRPFDLSKGLFCYGPAAIRSAYGLNGLLSSGSDGRGRTIVIIDAFGSPVAETDLTTFDTVYGLPPPPSFKQIYMPGTPPFDPNNANIVGWTSEIALDTQWSHAIAPAANIVLIAAKSNDDLDLLDAINYAIDNNLGDVISMSFGESEADISNPDGLDTVAAYTAAFAKAKAKHITLLASSGDQGSATEDYPFRSVGFPASSPHVTGVGGTNLFFGTGGAADPNGAYITETVWNDPFGAGGGGMSILFQIPDYQRDNIPRSVKQTLHGNRGVPDIAYNAGVVGGVIAAWTATIPGAFFIFGGTSAGAPQWSGIVADLNSGTGRRLGSLNSRLYRLGGEGALKPFFHDVTTGDNSFDGQPGYPATKGYDLSTGWGTPNLGKLGAAICQGDDD
jgi:subtilase family serine protease